MRKQFTYVYYSSLRGVGSKLYYIINKFQSDKKLSKLLKKGDYAWPDKYRELFTNTVEYELFQIVKIVCGSNLNVYSLEAFGHHLLADWMWYPPSKSRKDDFLDSDITERRYVSGDCDKYVKETIDKHNDKNYQCLLQKLLEIQPYDDEKYNLILLALLKDLEHPLFYDYATILKDFVICIIEAIIYAIEDGFDEEKFTERWNKINAISSIIEDPTLKERRKIFAQLNISKVSTNKITLNTTETELNNNSMGDNVFKELNTLIGLDGVKQEVKALVNYINVQQEREKSGLKNPQVSYHCVFTGSPGTGKTTVARIVAKIYKELGVLKKGHLVETDRSGLIAAYTGQTAIKVNQVVDSALDGVLFIDEAYSLVGESNDNYGKEAVATLIKRIEDDRDRLVVILAGYTQEMKTFIDTNPGFKSRFNRYIEFVDYNPAELKAIFKLQCSKQDYLLTEDADEKLTDLFIDIYKTRDKSFGNARDVRNIFEKTLERQASRIANLPSRNKKALTTLTIEDIADTTAGFAATGKEKDTLDDVLKELDTLVGLDSVKQEVQTLINYINIQEKRKKSGLQGTQVSYHCVFTGSPGTGKTTVARIIAKIYKHLGILKKGHLIETDRSGLIGEYLGQTAVKVNQVVDSALDGVLFIDEAYSLVGENNDDYGKEAVATLIKRIEDDRNRLIVILAGYTREMQVFIDTNPGFKSRFNRFIEFKDYNPANLEAIFKLQCKKQEYILTSDAERKLSNLLSSAYTTRGKDFGNARFVRNIFEKTLEKQANRIASLPEINEIIAEIDTTNKPDKSIIKNFFEKVLGRQDEQENNSRSSIPQLSPQSKEILTTITVEDIPCDDRTGNKEKKNVVQVETKTPEENIVPQSIVPNTPLESFKQAAGQIEQELIQKYATILKNERNYLFFDKTSFVALEPLQKGILDIRVSYGTLAYFNYSISPKDEKRLEKIEMVRQNISLEIKKYLSNSIDEKYYKVKTGKEPTLCEIKFMDDNNNGIFDVFKNTVVNLVALVINALIKKQYNEQF